MALHHELPIYRETYELLTKVVQVTRNIPRDFKRLIGEELRAECVKMMVLIFRANVATDKVQHIQELLERLQVVELMLRMSKDMRWISTGQYASLVAMTQNIGKQATGWKKHSNASPFHADGSHMLQGEYIYRPLVCWMPAPEVG